MAGGALSAGTVSLAVKADTKGFGARLGSQIRGESSHLSTAGKFLGGSLLGGVGLAMAGMGLVFKTGFDEAKDASAGIAQLTAGIKSTGNQAHVSVQGMTDLAGSIQAMSGQTDDSIVKSEQLLLTFTNIKNSGPDKIFDQATLASANMAAKMGGDASGSAILLGKALNDPVKGITALTRVGVSFTKGQKDSIAAMVKSGDTMGAQKLILKELNTEFGGAAKAAGESLPGQLEKAKRSFEDVSQSVTETLLPVVLPGLTSIGNGITKTVIPAVGAMVTAFKAGGDDVTSSGFAGFMERIGLAARKLSDWTTGTGIPALKTFATAFVIPAVTALGSFLVGTLVPALSNLVTWLRNNSVWLAPIAVGIGVIILAWQAYTAYLAIVAAATKAYSAVQGILNTVMAMNPIGLVIVALVALAAGLIYAYKTSETFRNIVDGVFQAIKVVIGNVVSVIITIFRDMLKVWTTVIGGLLSAAASVAETLHLPFAKSMRKASDAFNGMAKNADDKLASVAASASHWGDATGTNYAGGIKGGKPMVLTAAGVLAQAAQAKLLFNAQPQGAAVGNSYAAGISASTSMVQTAAGRLASAAQDRLNSLTHLSVPALAPPGRAVGGPVIAGQPYIVGENRAELFVPNVNGTIIPTVPTSTDGGGGGYSGADVVAAIGTQTAALKDAMSAMMRMQQTMQRQMAGAR